MKKRFILLISLILCSLCFLSCKEKELEAPELLLPVGVTVESVPVTRGDLTQTESHGGYMTPGSTAMYFQSEGVISNMNAFSGKWVEEGEILIEVSTDDLEEQIDLVTEEISYLQNELSYETQIASLDIQILQKEAEILSSDEEKESLYKGKLLEIEQASLRLKQLTEQMNRQISDKNKTLSELENDKEENVIRADKSGYVYFESGVSKGKSVHKDETAAFIIHPEEVLFKTDYYISEQSFKRYHVSLFMNGETYDVRLIPKTPEEVQALYISGKTLTSEFEVDFKGEPLENFEAGTYGVLLVDTKRSVDTLMVSSLAVSHDGMGDYVYVIEGNKRERRDIITGISNGIMTEVISGLQEGEQVYVQN